MMDEFVLTEEQLAIQIMAREFAERHIKPIAAEIDRMEVGTTVAESFPWGMVEEAHKIGLKTIALPEKYGGMGAGFLTQVVITDELAYVDSTCGKIISQQWKQPQNLIDYGTEDQKERFLTRFRDEPTYLLAGANTEPDYGSDNFLPYEGSEGGMKMSVKPTGDGYILNGIKHFIAMAAVASLYIVQARSDRTVPVKQGTSKFLVPRDTPGLSVNRVHDKAGWRAYGNAELAFEDVFVPKENLLGGKLNMDTFTDLATKVITVGASEMELAANAMGMARAAFESAMAWAKQRVQGGKPIIEHQAVAGVLADIYMELQALRSMVWHTASVLDRGEKNRALSLSCARFASKVLSRVTRDALSVFGGYGTEKDLPMERYVRDSLVFGHLADGPVRQVRVGNLLKKLY